MTNEDPETPTSSDESGGDLEQGGMPSRSERLAVLRTSLGFRLGTTIVVTGGFVFASYFMYRAIVQAVGKDTNFNFNFNFVVNVVVSLALTATISGGSIIWGRHHKARGDRLESENTRLRQARHQADVRAQQAEERAEGLASDLKALRAERDK